LSLEFLFFGAQIGCWVGGLGFESGYLYIAIPFIRES